MASYGLLTLRALRAFSFVLPVVACAPASAQAEPRFSFRIPAGPLAVALARLSAATTVDIGASGDLGRLTTRDVDGRLSISEALRRMLQGTGAHARRLPTGGWRIERVVAPPHRDIVRPLRAPPLSVASAPTADVVVLASKRATPLAHFPGSVTILDASGAGVDHDPVGSDALVARAAILSSTALGPGRNKLFIRGIADSAFTGVNQATTAQYLDDTRLTYHAADPNLILYDIRSVEVLEGPQGTLYGAGALGGVLRIVTEPPDLAEIAGSATVGGSLTMHGAPGADGAAMFNLPLVNDRLAVRAVGYGLSDGGYIDVPSDARRDINRVATIGGRIAARWRVGNGWTVDLRGVGQRIQGDDSQWADGAARPLTRDSAVPEPFLSKFLLGDLHIDRDLGATRLVSTISVSHQLVEESYHPAGVLGFEVDRYRQRSNTRLVAQETRFSDTAPDGSGWLLGFNLLSSRLAIGRELLAGNAPFVPGDLLIDRTTEITGFGQIAARLPLGLIATGGLRLSRTHLDHSSTARSLDDGSTESERLASAHAARGDTRLLPSASLSSSLSPTLFVFLRYGQAFRPGGLEFGNGVERPFGADRLASVEAGVRIGRMSGPVWLSMALAHTRWSDIQADEVSEAGLPITTNIGRATISTFELKGQWRPRRGVRVDATVFVNRSHLDEDRPPMGSRTDDLPNVAKLCASLGVAGAWAVGGRDRSVTVDAQLRYMGSSRLGVGPILSSRQGGYLDSEVFARWGDAARGVSVRATNVLDSGGNRFAFGSPFQLAIGQQTPQRPLTVRLGLDTRF